MSNHLLKYKVAFTSAVKKCFGRMLLFFESLHSYKFCIQSNFYRLPLDSIEYCCIFYPVILLSRCWILIEPNKKYYKWKIIRHYRFIRIRADKWMALLKSLLNNKTFLERNTTWRLLCKLRIEWIIFASRSWILYDLYCDGEDKNQMRYANIWLTTRTHTYIHTWNCLWRLRIKKLWKIFHILVSIFSCSLQPFFSRWAKWSWKFG